MPLKSQLLATALTLLSLLWYLGSSDVKVSGVAGGYQIKEA